MKLSDLPLPAIPATAVLFTAAIYTRGWLRLRHTSPMTFPSWRVGSFLAGLCLMLLALSDPVDELADSLLIAHMTQHIFCMSATCNPWLANHSFDTRFATMAVSSHRLGNSITTPAHGLRMDRASVSDSVVDGDCFCCVECSGTL